MKRVIGFKGTVNSEMYFACFSKSSSENNPLFEDHKQRNIPKMVEKPPAEVLDDVIVLISEIEAAFTRITKLLEQEAPRWREEVGSSNFRLLCAAKIKLKK